MEPHWTQFGDLVLPFNDPHNMDISSWVLTYHAIINSLNGRSRYFVCEATFHKLWMKTHEMDSKTAYTVGYFKPRHEKKLHQKILNVNYNYLNNVDFRSI